MIESSKMIEWFKLAAREIVEGACPLCRVLLEVLVTVATIHPP